MNDDAPLKKRKIEAIKANATFMAGVSGAVTVTDQPRLSQIQHKVQDFCGWNKLVSPQPFYSASERFMVIYV